MALIGNVDIIITMEIHGKLLPGYPFEDSSLLMGTFALYSSGY